MSSGEIKHSCLYKGHIRHRRFTPVLNSFKYSMFMWYLDLDELEAIAKKKWFFRLNKLGFVSFFRNDYFDAESSSLKQSVIDRVAGFYRLNQQAVPEIHSVRMLTHVRYFNLLFNPVSFYYCFDAQNKLVAILAEITNTPWDERHSYVLPYWGDGQTASFSTFDHATLSTEQRGEHARQFTFDKKFHVSPFNPMNMQYDWTFNTPDQKLAVHMESKLLAPEASSTGEHLEKHFDATLGMQRVPLEQSGKIVIGQPFMTVKVILGIYWQALKLWVKRSPFYDHPSYSRSESTSKT